MASQGTKKRKRDSESHDSSIESPPRMDSTLNLAKEIMENVKNTINRVTDNLDEASMIRDIISKINQMEKVSRKKTTIGIFGKSGEGKSSLLNAVLGKKDLLPSGCFGACTAVVTRVEANLEDSNYIAEIELFSKEEWEKELKDLFSVLSDESKDRNDDLFDMAVEKITALYGEDADKKTLEELKKDDKFAEIETLLSICKKISKSDVFEFTNEVASYTQHSESSSGGWYSPLVKCVTIKIPDCHELLEHIVFVDIPGTGDCNKIRDDKWKSKLRECSFVWIVSDINRAITDKDPLKHCTTELGPGGECKRINFICTKTDEINPAAYMRSARLTTDQRTGGQDLEKVCILHRNKHAKMRIKEKFENSDIKKIVSTDSDFLVFTVSSKAFFDPKLNLEPSESEIPKLQDNLRILNKNITRDLSRDYVNAAKGLLSLIQSVQPDTDKETVKMKDKVFMEFEESLMKALNELDIRFDTIYRVLDQCLSKGVEKSVNLCDASTEAMIKHNKVSYQTLAALCRNGGCYFSKGRKELLDLNKALAENLHECIEEDFKQIFPVGGQTGKSVQEQIDKFSIIQTDYFRSSMLNHVQKFIQTEETELKASLNREVIDIKKDIFLSIQTTIENEMASSYEQAAEIRGDGALKRTQDLLINTVKEKKQDMFNKAKNETLKRFNNLKLYIKNALESGLKTSIKLALSQTSKIKLMDVSRESEQLERRCSPDWPIGTWPRP